MLSSISSLCAIPTRWPPSPQNGATHQGKGNHGMFDNQHNDEIFLILDDSGVPRGSVLFPSSTCFGTP